MSVNDLGELLAGPGEGRRGLQLIDVREDGEYAAASLPGFQLLPLSRCAAVSCLQEDRLAAEYIEHGVDWEWSFSIGIGGTLDAGGFPPNLISLGVNGTNSQLHPFAMHRHTGGCRLLSRVACFVQHFELLVWAACGCRNNYTLQVMKQCAIVGGLPCQVNSGNERNVSEPGDLT